MPACFEVMTPCTIGYPNRTTSQYILKLLACPVANVLSEMAFSAADGFVTEGQIHLSPEIVAQLIFVKINQSRISNDAKKLTIPPPAISTVIEKIHFNCIAL